MFVALLTDFGPASPYVGAMKGVIARLAPEARVIDIAHDIPPQAVDQAGFVLRHSYRFFPEETVFACVVDPGVGTERPIVVAQVERRLFVAPAGALLGDIYQAEPALRAFEATDRSLWLRDVSSTFHGRDVFAPLAARLATGLAPEHVGPERAPRELIERRPAPRPDHGRVRMVDRFGNLISDVLAPTDWNEGSWVEVGGHRVCAAARTYGEAPPAPTPFFYAGSFGTIEVAIQGGNAAQRLGLGPGAELRLVRAALAGASAHTEATSPEV